MLRRNLRIIGGIFLAVTLLETCAMSSQPLLIKMILDRLNQGRPVSWILCWFSGTIIVITSLEFVGQRLQSHFQKVALDGLRSRVIDSIFGSTPVRLTKDGVADGVAAINNDIPVVVNEYYGAWLMIGMRTVMILVIAISIFSLGLPYFILIALSTLITLVVPKFFKKETARRRKASLAKAHEMNGVLQDVLDCMPIITSCLTRPQWRAKFLDKSEEHTTFERAVGWYSAKVNVVVGLTFFAGQFTLVWLAVFLIGSGHSTVGAFVAASQFATMLVSPVQSLAGALNKLNSGRSALSTLEESYPAIAFDGEVPEPIDFESLELQGVTVQYEGGVPIVLPDLCLRSGERVLLVGPNGCGKSSLFELILGGLAPLTGTVRLNGSDYYRSRRADLLAVLGVAPQNAPVADASIRENVSMLRPIEPKAVDVAITKVGLSEAVMGQGRKGEHTRGLSGGERQRVSLARALVTRPQLLLMDESLSQIDAESRARLMKDLLSQNTDLTVLAISHYEEDAALFDRVVFFPPREACGSQGVPVAVANG